MMDRASVERELVAALENLVSRHCYLLEVDANEPTLTAHLSSCLSERFKGWNVDPEYNRNVANRNKVKSLGGRLVRPDIIIHKRGTLENLLVIEVKKAGATPADIEHDVTKLQGYRTDPEFRYAYAVLVTIGEHGAERLYKMEWF